MLESTDSPSVVQLELPFDEEWRDIPGYSQFYEVSNNGKVRVKIKRLRGYPAGTLMKQARSSDGYLAVSLTKDGDTKRICVHRLVMLAFVGEPGELEVNHKDGDKSHNHVSNLEYMTHLENIQHAHDVLNAAFGVRGVRNGRAILSPDQVIEIRGRCAAGEALTALGKEYGVSSTTISLIRDREIWKMIPG